jgi:hypothetical protein
MCCDPFRQSQNQNQEYDVKDKGDFRMYILNEKNWLQPIDAPN